MKLHEALLCIDCEALYSMSSHCPECGSQVAYPLGRALNRDASTSGAHAAPAPKPRRRTHGLRPLPQRAGAGQPVAQRA